MLTASPGIPEVTELTPKQRAARDRVCLPLDGLHTLDGVRALLDELSPYVGMFKIGKESFTRFGPEVVTLVHTHGSGVFLDLKYHDIPNTVKGAARAAAELGVALFNVHASGGMAMMAAARQGVEEATAGGRAPRVIAVTVLTSVDQDILNDEVGVPGTVEDQVLRLAKLTEAAGLDGIVCSAADLHALKGHVRPEFLFVTPGIKGTTTPAGEDQKRVLSPGRAVTAGSSLLVVGRAITAAPDRPAAALEVLTDIADVL
jgi:orotidine-5'-phosphate decarboxylase